MNGFNQVYSFTPSEAKQLQEQLRPRISLTRLVANARYIAGMDISFEKGSKRAFAGIVVLDLSTLKIVTQSWAETFVNFPYIPGLLSFREIPPLKEAWNSLSLTPDVVMIDGHGIAHPRRFGLACHFGLMTNTPTFGCAKKLLTGKYQEPGQEKGSWEYLKGDEGGETLTQLGRLNRFYPQNSKYSIN